MRMCVTTLSVTLLLVWLAAPSSAAYGTRSTFGFPSTLVDEHDLAALESNVVWVVEQVVSDNVREGVTEWTQRLRVSVSDTQRPLVAAGIKEREESVEQLLARATGYEIVNEDNGVSAAPGRELLVTQRRDMMNQEVLSDRFCARDEKTGECNWMGYGVYLASLLIIRVVLFLLCVLFIPVFCCLRCVCGCCGGRKPNKGICCGEEKPGYTSDTIKAIKIIAVLATIVVVACMIAGQVGNGKVHKGLKAFADALLGAGDHVIESAEEAGAALSALPYTQDAGTAIDNAIQPAREIRKVIVDAKQTVLNYDGYRVVGTQISFVVPTIFILAGTVLGAVFNIRMSWFLIPLSMLLLLLTAVVWVSVGVHDVISTVILDICVEFDNFIAGYAKGQGGADPNNPLTTLLSCVNDGNSAFQPFVDLIDDAIADANAQICFHLNSLCNVSTDGYTYPYSSLNSSMWPANFSGPPQSQLVRCDLPCVGAASIDNSSIEDPPFSGNWVFFRDCPTDCATAAYANTTAILIEQANIIKAYEKVFRTKIIPLLNCKFLLDLIVEIQEAVCTFIGSGLKTIKRSQQGMAITSMGLSIVFVMGVKRFVPLSEAVENQHTATKVAPVDMGEWQGAEGSDYSYSGSYSYSDSEPPGYADKPGFSGIPGPMGGPRAAPVLNQKAW